MSERVRIHEVITLSDDWYTLKKTIFDYRAKDGTWERQSRETYDRGNGAVILLYNRRHKTVILTRQFRFPTYVNGNPDGMLIEAPAGLLDQENPEAAIRRETAEETGYHIHNPRKVLEVYMSPGSVTEMLYFFVAEYDAADRLERGGGVASDGEEIETIELPLDEALTMIDLGQIKDTKTIMLLQYAKLKGLLDE
jgi:nudix-type nucleoside diphosphatase (YffH/AdpP family)